jgi:hypothetical protein
MNKIKKFFTTLALTSIFVFAGALAAHAQLGGIGGIGNKILKKTPGVDSFLEGKPPIATSLPDAIWGDASKDGFTPREAQRSLMTFSAPRTVALFCSPDIIQCRIRVTA